MKFNLIPSTKSTGFGDAGAGDIPDWLVRQPVYCCFLITNIWSGTGLLSAFLLCHCTGSHRAFHFYHCGCAISVFAAVVYLCIRQTEGIGFGIYCLSVSLSVDHSDQIQWRHSSDCSNFMLALYKVKDLLLWLALFGGGHWLHWDTRTGPQFPEFLHGVAAGLYHYNAEFRLMASVINMAGYF